MCYFLVKRIFVSGLSVVDTYQFGEARIQESPAILDAATDEHDGYSCLLCMAQHNAWQLAHERLCIGRALARDDKIGMLQHVVEMIASQHQFSATLHLSIHELHEGIAQTTGCTGTRSLAHVETLMLGCHRSKGCSTPLKKFHLRGIGSFLWRKYVGGTMRSREWTVDIGGKSNAE